MKIKVFDANHESDLEKKVNEFIKKENCEIIDIKFSNCCMKDKDNDQLYFLYLLLLHLLFFLNLFRDWHQ